jgi:hypothetical protein
MTASTDMLHGFTIPHDKVMCMGDAITIRVPEPPKRVGSFEIPGQVRDIVQHNIVAGRIMGIGPIAFMHKDVTGKPVPSGVKIGDWVIFRPFAGSLIQPDGKVGAVGGVRYLSSYRDVLGVIPAADMAIADAILAAEDYDAATEAYEATAHAERMAKVRAESEVREKEAAERLAKQRESMIR